MRHNIHLFIFWLTSTIISVQSNSFAQVTEPTSESEAPKVFYDYDAAGNRILRRIALSDDSWRMASQTQPTEQALIEQEGYEINAYPNPVQNHLTVDVSPFILELNEHRLTVSDMNGRILQQQNIVGVRTQLDVSALASGNYILKVWADEHSQEWQVVKE